jgi:hypothetical protein
MLPVVAIVAQVVSLPSGAFAGKLIRSAFDQEQIYLEKVFKWKRK